MSVNNIFQNRATIKTVGDLKSALAGFPDCAELVLDNYPRQPELDFVLHEGISLGGDLDGIVILYIFAAGGN